MLTVFGQEFILHLKLTTDAYRFIYMCISSCFFAALILFVVVVDKPWNTGLFFFITNCHSSLHQRGKVQATFLLSILSLLRLADTDTLTKHVTATTLHPPPPKGTFLHLYGLSASALCCVYHASVTKAGEGKSGGEKV